MFAPKKPDRWLGPVRLIRGRTTPFADQLRDMGFERRKRSGKVADGGPGHTVPADYVVPVSRWKHNPILRLQVQLLFMEANGAPVKDIVEAKLQLKQFAIAKREEQLQAAQAT